MGMGSTLLQAASLTPVPSVETATRMAEAKTPPKEDASATMIRERRPLHEAAFKCAYATVGQRFPASSVAASFTLLLSSLSSSRCSSLIIWRLGIWLSLL